MRTGLIYKITNQYNGYVYIGQTVQTLEQRWKQHIKYAFSSGKSSNMVIARAIRKYGADAFSVEVIAKNIPETLLDATEQFWILHFNSFAQGYNCTLGGRGSRGHSPWNKGKYSCYSEATLEKMREAKLSMTPTNLEQLHLLAKERTGLKHQNAKLANVYCFKTKQLIAENVSLSEWAREHGYNRGNLCATARGERSSTKGVFAIYLQGDPSS